MKTREEHSGCKESGDQKEHSWFNSWVGKIHWQRDRLPTPVLLGFLCGSAGKDSVHNAGDLSSIPGLGRSPGEGERSSILAWRIPRTIQSMGSQRVRQQLSDCHFHFHLVKGNGSEALRTRSEKGKKAEMKIEGQDQKQMYLQNNHDAPHLVLGEQWTSFFVAVTHCHSRAPSNRRYQTSVVLCI